METPLPPPDEPDLIVSDLAESATRGRFPREVRPLLNVLSAVVAVALLVAGVFWLRGVGHLPGTKTAQQGKPPFSVLSATPPSLPSAGQGWIDAGLGQAQTIAVAPNDARRLYTCASVTTMTADGTTFHTILGVSDDGGVTWHNLELPSQDFGCEISVDPTDASDLILGCSSCARSSLPVGFMRSYDGGVHWQTITLPPRPDGAVPSSYYNVTSAWAGSTLFLATTPDNGNTTWLAAMPAHGTGIWVDQRGLFSGMGRNAVITQLFAFHTTLYAQLGSQTASNCSPCTLLMRSSDGGASWHAVSHTGNETPNVAGGVDDGSALLGYAGSGAGDQRLSRSFDGGTVWQLLPSFPPATLYELNVYQTPDRSLYASLYFTNNRIALYKVVPGASTWQLVAPLPDNGEIIGVSFDAKGHPVAIWGSRADGAGKTSVQRHVP